MTALRPTPTRIHLLRNAAEYNLRWTERKGFTLHSTSVNAKLEELERAGWVERINTGDRQAVVVTDAGRAVLAADEPTACICPTARYDANGGVEPLPQGTDPGCRHCHPASEKAAVPDCDIVCRCHHDDPDW